MAGCQSCAPVPCSRPDGSVAVAPAWTIRACQLAEYADFNVGSKARQLICSLLHVHARWDRSLEGAAAPSVWMLRIHSRRLCAAASAALVLTLTTIGWWWTTDTRSASVRVILSHCMPVCCCNREQLHDDCCLICFCSRYSSGAPACTLVSNSSCCMCTSATACTQRRDLNGTTLFAGTEFGLEPIRWKRQVLHASSPRGHWLNLATQQNVDSHAHAQVKFGVKLPSVKALSHENADPQLWPRPKDVYIVSYPKVRQRMREAHVLDAAVYTTVLSFCAQSGQTWIRFLLANLIRYEEAVATMKPRSAAAARLIEPIDFDTVESRIPFLEDGREEWIAWAFKAAPIPRIFKSHQPILHPPAVSLPDVAMQLIQLATRQTLMPWSSFSRIWMVARRSTRAASG
eukprot:COSAG02_NODE_289_length_25587_cov_34.270323_3_plen_401_part_00